VVELFEAAGEANIEAVCRRQRGSLMRWLGRERYEDLLNQCLMVSDQTLRALQTQDTQEAAKARWFRDAVVNQVRRSAEMDLQDLPG
jgi:hypothetical protein